MRAHSSQAEQLATDLIIQFRAAIEAAKKTEPDEAHEQDRTVDLILTKNVLYRLSYVGLVGREGFEPP